MNLNKLPIIFLAFIFFISCKSGKNGSTTAGNGKDSVVLKLHPTDNTAIYYTITTASDISENVNGQTNETETNFDLGLKYNIKKDTSGNYRFSIQYDQFKTHVKANGEDHDEDASTADQSLNPQEKMFAVFKNAEIVGIVSPAGNIVSVTGIDVLGNKLYALTNSDPSMLQAADNFKKQFLQTDFFKDNIAQSFKAYPGKALKIGDTWNSNDTLNSVLKLPISNTYQVTALDDSIATISISSTIKTDNQSLSVQGYSATASLDATQDGEIDVDIASGLILSSNNELDLKGTLSIMNKDVPIDFKIKTTVTGKKE